MRGKLFCCEAATQITMEAIHILGGNGYMEEYEV
ncbi:MAG: acyl-CoA dehydrogenase family protein, partial [Candidatus Binatia bacterium]